MTKRMLLNASQRKYLIDRINRHAGILKRDDTPDRYDDEEDDGEPSEIVAARKLINDWITKEREDKQARLSHRKNTVDRYSEKLEEAMLFEASETALRKVAEFEEMTWEDLECVATKRSPSPNWDK